MIECFCSAILLSAFSARTSLLMLRLNTFLKHCFSSSMYVNVAAWSIELQNGAHVADCKNPTVAIRNCKMSSVEQQTVARKWVNVSSKQFSIRNRRGISFTTAGRRLCYLNEGEQLTLSRFTATCWFAPWMSLFLIISLLLMKSQLCLMTGKENLFELSLSKETFSSFLLS